MSLTPTDSSDFDPASLDLSSLGGGFDMSGLLAQAQALQQQMTDAQAELATVELVGTSGGDLVEITLMGDGEIKSCTIKPGAIDAEDPETLQDLVVAAFRDAQSKLAAAAAATMGPMASGFGF